MYPNSEDKVALVTGAGSGIGRASAIAFAKNMVKVIVVDIDTKGGEETVHVIQKIGSEAIFIKADVSRALEVEEMVKEAIKSCGRLDYAHNNAGTGIGTASIIDLAEKEWDTVINVNLKGVWLCMKYEIPQMIKQGSGAIVNTSSVFGLIGGLKRAAYTASKHGIIGLTKVAALEYAKAGIRVNAICPGRVLTPAVQRVIGTDPQAEKLRTATDPMQRMATPEEIADCVAWLCSSASFVTGHAMVVDGGISIQ